MTRRRRDARAARVGPVALLVALASLASTGCAPPTVTVDYVGRTLAPTTRVDLHLDPGTIERPHEVIGRGLAEAPNELTFEEMQERLVVEAMERGADAVLIDAIDTVVTGATTSSTGGGPYFYESTASGRIRHVGGGFGTISSRTRIRRNKMLQATFLRYTDAPLRPMPPARGSVDPAAG